MRTTQSLMPVGPMIFLCTLLLGCGSSVTPENFEKIQSGMSQEEVKAILGDPTESSGIAIGPVGGTTATWKANDRTITIQFVNGKVIAKMLSGKKP